MKAIIFDLVIFWALAVIFVALNLLAIEAAFYAPVLGLALFGVTFVVGCKFGRVVQAMIKEHF